MRYFFSSGEASGELTAVALAEAIRQLDPEAQFEGVGSARMRAAGFRIVSDHSGWASMGPIAAIPRIPKLLAIGLRIALHILRAKPDLVVLVDFGAFNIRLAQVLRTMRYRGAILDLYPPGTWLDDPKRAAAVARVAVPLTAFEHQRDFFRALGLPIAFFGHPLASRYSERPPRDAASREGGTVALLPGSRKSEIAYHAPLLFAAYTLLKKSRPQLHGVVSAANEYLERQLRTLAEQSNLRELVFARGTLNAIKEADAAWVSSGTAVLECALSGVPEVVLYVVSPRIERYAQRLRAGRFVALPNLVLQRGIIPELLQEQATPERLAAEMDALLRDPGSQYAEFKRFRIALGPPDALERCAAFAVALAKGDSSASLSYG